MNESEFLTPGVAFHVGIQLVDFCWITFEDHGGPVPANWPEKNIQGGTSYKLDNWVITRMNGLITG